MTRFFTALVAPSLTGKTQAAFTIKSKLPLYLVFDQSQEIYRPFYQLSDEFRSIAIDDVASVKKHLIKTKKWPKDSFNISSDIFLSLKIKLKTLGLMRALFEEAHAFECDSTKIRDDWMFHLSRSRVISYEPITISEYTVAAKQKEFVKKYCVFLDEFKGEEALIFIRNLCRYLTLSCVLSSTNSKVANLIGLSPITSSRGDGPGAWSVVFDNLGPFMPQSLESNDTYKEAISYLIDLASKTSEKEGHRMILLAKYLEIQCLSSRPGFAHMMMEIIYDLKKNYLNTFKMFQVDDLFEYLIINLTRNLETRKPQAFSGVKSSEAYCRIITGRYFENLSKENDGNDTAPLIDQHFFHLANPNQPPEEPFLLTKMILDGSPCLTIPNGDIFDINTYFNPNEEILMLTCLFNGLKRSTRSVLGPVGTATPLGLVSNKLAIKRSGKYLENDVSQAIIDASHGSSFRGTQLGPFLRNVLKNFNPSLMPLKRTRLLISSEIANSFKNLSVPFLFPVQMKVPELIGKIFPRNESKLRFGSYLKTADIDEIDAVFDLDLKNSNKSVKALIETKNLSDNLTGSDYLKILNKFFKYDSRNSDSEFPINLTFCSNLSNPKKLSIETMSELKNLSISKKINFLRLVPHKSISNEDNFVLFNEIGIGPKLDGSNQENSILVSFELTSLDHSVFPIHSEPKFTAIIVETDTIIESFKTQKY
jgi:hypothetical protein